MTYPFDWVEDAILGHLYASLPEMKGKIALKNVTFDASQHKLWLKVINTPSSEYVATLGDTGDNEYVGFVQLGVYTAIGVGQVETKEVLGKLGKAFRVPQHLQAPENCLLRLTRKDFSQGGQTSISDFTRGGTEKMWDANYITVYWLAREPR